MRRYVKPLSYPEYRSNARLVASQNWLKNQDSAVQEPWRSKSLEWRHLNEFDQFIFRSRFLLETD